MQVPSDPYVNQTSKTKVWLVVGIVVLVAILGFGLGAGIFGLGGKSGAPSLGFVGKNNAPVLASNGGPAGPVLPAVGKDSPVLPADNSMPKDILDWLKHLEETERRRVALCDQQGAQLSILLGKVLGTGSANPMKDLFGEEGPNVENLPSNDVKDQTAKLRQDWQDIDEFFQSVPPPSECAPIQASFSQTLSETPAMILELADILGTVSDDQQKAVEKLIAMRGKSPGRIDNSATRCNDLVQQICDKYKVRKWFTVKRDPSEGLAKLIPGL
ncbi:MAG: hypothetical protein JSS65_09325 [Armatimonadetes bacterium]|nr:hypothetical protein [Armatimonadota bacterium]